jgi:hypothetical protein
MRRQGTSAVRSNGRRVGTYALAKAKDEKYGLATGFTLLVLEILGVLEQSPQRTHTRNFFVESGHPRRGHMQEHAAPTRMTSY